MLYLQPMFGTRPKLKILGWTFLFLAQRANILNGCVLLLIEILGWTFLFLAPRANILNVRRAGEKCPAQNIQPVIQKRQLYSKQMWAPSSLYGNN